MNRCPNCNAELTAKPCPACGWPDTTQPSDAERARVARQLAATQREDRPGGGCARSCMVIGAILATAAATGFYRIGSAARWTSDGPGILVVMLGFAGCGLLALILWTSLVMDFLAPWLPSWVRFWIDEDE